MATTVSEFVKIQLHELGISLCASQFDKLLNIVNEVQLEDFFSPESFVAFIEVEARKLLRPLHSPSKYQPPMFTKSPALEFHSQLCQAEADMADYQNRLHQAEANLKTTKIRVLKVEQDLEELKQEIASSSSVKAMKQTSSLSNSGTHLTYYHGGFKYWARK